MIFNLLGKDGGYSTNGEACWLPRRIEEADLWSCAASCPPENTSPGEVNYKIVTTRPNSYWSNSSCACFVRRRFCSRTLSHRRWECTWALLFSASPRVIRSEREPDHVRRTRLRSAEIEIIRFSWGFQRAWRTSPAPLFEWCSLLVASRL